ncbi:MAG: type II toxin-antitoxin system MqsA family antitoxin [Chloroflexi bacterium]|nr:type II toxin-antitoxin system MqsA family antitoxin [Chloroflexota bacterium]
MNCVICRRPEIAAGFTSIAFERDEVTLVINSVPTQICRNCGEAYLEEDINIHLLGLVEEIVEEGITHGEYDYTELVDKK